MIQPWTTTADNLVLQSNEIQIWSTTLDVRSEEVDNYFGFLGDDERERAQKFRFWHHKRRYVIGRGILRILLGRYLNTEPGKIDFQYNEFGKPFLPTGNLQFNLAHTRDSAIYAFCLNAAVGVDLEYIRPIEDMSGIASRFFSHAENEVIKSAPADKQINLFFTYWTLKEAYIKAVGQGLSLPLDSFEILFTEKQGPRIFRIGDNYEEPGNWSLFFLETVNDCAAAVAVQGRNWQISKKYLPCENLLGPIE
jgi:4'-phosphopantetheinyl transferase